FCLYSSVPSLHLPSFPTRRSSDLLLAARRSRIEVAQSAACGVLLIPLHSAGSAFWLATSDRAFLSSAYSPGPRARPAVLLSRKLDRKSTRLNSSHVAISYAVFCLK